MQRLFGIVLKALLLHLEPLGVTRLAQDIGNPLVRRGETLRLVEPRKGLHGSQPTIEINQRRRRARNNSVEGLGAQPAIAIQEVPPQAISNKRVQVDLELAGFDLTFGLFGNRPGNQRLEVNVETALDQDSNNAQRRPAQSEWIAVAARLLADREDPGEGVQLFCDGDRLAGARLWQLVTGEAWQVMLGDGIGDDGGFALAEFPSGRWRVETRAVGFLPIWVVANFDVDLEVTLSLVPQPAGYDPSPLELMPPEQPLPPARFLAEPQTPAAEEADEEESQVAER